MKPGPKAKCQCGVCRTCKNRVARQKFYRANREDIIYRNRGYTLGRRGEVRVEVGDEEMDRRAKEMGV